MLSVPQKSESVVTAGTPIVTLGDPSRVDVVAEFLSQDVVRMKPGDRALIENWGGDAVAAIVKRIEPVARTKVSALGIEEQRTRVVLRFVGTAPEPLRAHDYRVDTRVVLAEQRDAIRVPLGALMRLGNNWTVYRLARGRVEKVMVTVGVQDTGYGVVEQGLTVGDEVVIFPFAQLEDGVRVRTVP